MGRYQSASGSLPNGEYKSEPRALPQEAFGQAITPAEQVVHETPWYVLVNNSGSYNFLYSTTGSIGSTYGGASNYSLGINIPGALGQPIKLDINPSAWSGSDSATTGDITFIYRGGL